VRETVAVARPPSEVYAVLAQPDQRPAGGAWRELVRDEDAYRAKLYATAGPIQLDFDCRFELIERRDGESVRLRGLCISPRLGFTFEGTLAVQAEDGGSTVDVDVEVLPAGALAGLGQRRLGEQERRLVAEFVAGETSRG
jgi:carbon monoxide dehydrogenase subunit G